MTADENVIARLDHLETRFDRVEQGQAELKALLARLEPTIVRVAEELKSENRAMRERLARVEGRLEEQSKFLQLALAG